MITISASAKPHVHLIDHPLVQHKLTLMRKKEASTNSFRRLLGELSSLMAYEVTRDMTTQDVEIETPLEPMQAKMIDGKKLVFVSILRAGNGILDGVGPLNMALVIVVVSFNTCINIHPCIM